MTSTPTGEHVHDYAHDHAAHAHKAQDHAGSCCHRGPGYATPLDAYHNGPKETLLYIPCVVPDKSRPDYVATVDVDPASPHFGTVIHRLPMPHLGDELHHSGWNSCSSCHADPGAPARKLLVLPTLGTGRVYGVDVATDPRAPRLAATAEPEDIKAATGLSFLHSSHCAPSGDIMVSAMGDQNGDGKGGFVLLSQDLKVKGKWSHDETPYGYDFWYQPRLNVMVSSEWGSPNAFKNGFNPADIETKYGNNLYFWDWTTRTITQTIKLGPKGLIPLELRFLHEPTSAHGFVGAALSSNVIHFTRPAEGEQWVTDVAIEQEWTQVEGWVLPSMPPLITDILISLDDKFLYFSNWLRGDVVQFDISDPAHPKLAGRVWVGGAIRKGSSVKILGGLPEGTTEAPDVPDVKGVRLRGGPQMLQLSLDGKRLYVTNSLYSPWDGQFYPEMITGGSHLIRINVDTENGGLSVDPDFLVDFGAEPDGPVLAHEVRYPGGDCSSDIWI